MTRPLDILIVTVPHDELDHPRSAPAVLKGIVEHHGHRCGTLNTATLLYEQLGRSVPRFMQAQEYFVDYNRDLPHCLEIWYQRVIAQLKARPARFIGISVFTGWSHVAAVELCQRIRAEMPGQRVIVGGKGLDVKPFDNTQTKCSISPEYMQKEIHHYFTDHGLVDGAILGDAERAIVQFLSQNDPVTKLRVPIDPVLKFPHPDFEDVDTSLYIGANKDRPGEQVQLPVVSSKGCVRACDFCDVPAFNPRYMYKPGRALYEELVALADRHGIRDFAFVDSIANGNMKQLKEAVQLLKQHNLQHPDRRITWSGNWIARPINQQGDSQFYDDLKLSGLSSVTVGAEHWSNSVLESMNKKTTAEAFWRELDEFDRVGIPVLINTITGHWSETFDDFVIWLKSITRLQRYVAKGTVFGITTGSGFHLLDKTPASRNPDLVAFEKNWNFLFYAKSNPNMGFTERIYRTLISNIHLKALNSKLIRTVLKKLLDYINNDWENITKLQKMVPYTKHTTPEKSFYDKVEEFSRDLIAQEYDSFDARLVLTANSGGLGLPHVRIKFNDEVLFDQILRKGDNILEFVLKYDHTLGNKLELELTNKHNTKDTILDDQGNIMADKNVEFKSIRLDDVELVEKFNFWKSNVSIHTGNEISHEYQMGLWQNQSIIIKFQKPIPIETCLSPSYYYLSEGHDQERNNEITKEIEKKLVLLDSMSKKNQKKVLKSFKSN